MMKSIKGEMNLNSLTLVFNDKTREKEYSYFRYLQKRLVVKIFLIIFLILYFGIIAMDYYVLEIKSNIIFSMKFAVLFLGILFLLLFNKISFLKHTRYVVMFISLVYLSIICQALFYPGTENVNVYMIGYSMVVYGSYFLTGLRLKDSFILNIIAQLIFYTLLIYQNPQQTNMIAYLLLLLQANILFLFSAYHLENTSRQLFFYINKLELENENQVKLYKLLEDNNETQIIENSKIETPIIETPIIETPIERKKYINTKNNILIVDDEKDNVLYFEQVALKLRLNLFKARNGLDAVKIYKKYKSDIALILMDVKMPEMNGYEATKEIKKINSDIPVILITAYSEEVRNESEADLILSKPITPKALTEAIKRYI